MRAGKTKPKKWNKSNRRTHSSIDKLPREVQVAVKLMLIGKKWPTDYKNHYDGIPRYKDVVEYCRAKGYIVARSSVGRYAKRIAPLFNQDVCDLDSVWHNGIAAACKDYCETVDDLIRCLINKSPEGVYTLPRIQEQAINQLMYIGRAIQAVKPLEAGGSLGRGGAR